jgi:hypothetical protein
MKAFEVRIEYKEEADTREVVIRSSVVSGLAFALLLFGIYRAIFHNGTWAEDFVPFLWGWIWMVNAKESLLVSKDRLVVTVGSWIFKRRTEFMLDSIDGVQVSTSKYAAVRGVGFYPPLTVTSAGRRRRLMWGASTSDAKKVFSWLNKV